MMKDLMRTNAPFIRKLAALLAVVVLRTSTAGAVSLPPGSLAVLEPSFPAPEMRAAWDEIRSGIYLDPLLLVKGREEVSRKLHHWRQGAESVQTAHRTADRITLDRTRSLIEEAWSLYYRFEYRKAEEVLTRARELLVTPGDSGFRTRLMHEILVLGGVVSRAAGSADHIQYFKKAVALDPDRELPPERYSPQTLSLYARTRNNLLSEEKVLLTAEGTPADALVRVAGGEAGKMSRESGFKVLPGQHFLQVSAPGYEPWSAAVEVETLEPAIVRFELMPAGPEGDPDSFFLRRLRSGDTLYMSLLSQKLGVDYLFVPDPGESQLMGWLINKKGHTVKHLVIWSSGETAQTGAGRLGEVLQPLRHQWDRTAGVPLTLPPRQQGQADGPGSFKKGGNWKKYAIAVGLILLVGAAAGSDRGQNTTVEATW